MKCAVYTAITGGKDVLRDDQCTAGASFTAFLNPLTPSKTWQVKRACDLFQDPRRNARIHKILVHQYFPDYEYSLWMDGPASLKVPVAELVEKYLEDADLCLFKHPERDCLYEEADKCVQWGLAQPEVLDEQTRKYEKEGYPTHHGLFETGLLLRRHSSKMERFNNYWWSELCRHSKRDQVSIPYVLDKLGLKYNLFEGTIKTKNNRAGNVYFDYGGHAK